MILVGEVWVHHSSSQLVCVTKINECYIEFNYEISGVILSATWIKDDFSCDFSKVTELTLALS